MRLRIYSDGDRQVAEVTLSRRNLLALLHKLEMPGSARTIWREEDEPGWLLVVRSEDDDDHYLDRPAPSGPMHPLTELAILLHNFPSWRDAQVPDREERTRNACDEAPDWG